MAFPTGKMVLINGQEIPVRSFTYSEAKLDPIPCTFDGTEGSCLLCDEHLRPTRPITFMLEMSIENVSRRLMELMIGRRLPCPQMKKWRQKRKVW